MLILHSERRLALLLHLAICGGAVVFHRFVKHLRNEQPGWLRKPDMSHGRRMEGGSGHFQSFAQI